MEQVSDNILVIYPGEMFPEGTENSIKILLSGSIDTREDKKYDWASKFIEGLKSLTSPDKGLIQYQGLNFIIANSFVSPGNPAANIMNPEFQQKTNWMFQMIAGCDAIFINFLKKSTSAIPLFWFGYCCSSGKCVVRCPEEYINYGIVRMTCQNHSISLLPGRVGNVLSVLQALAVYTPKFQEVQKYQLPE